MYHCGVREYRGWFYAILSISPDEPHGILPDGACCPYPRADLWGDPYHGFEFIAVRFDTPTLVGGVYTKGKVIE